MAVQEPAGDGSGRSLDRSTVVLSTDKGMPAWAAGLSIDAVVRRGPRVGVDGFLLPLLTADAEALDGNVVEMAGWVSGHGALLCPHGKTTMSPQVIGRQLGAGAWGVTAATVSQVRTFREFGVDRILLANELVDPAGLDWLLAELDRDPSFEVFVYVDSLAGLAVAAEALARRGPGRALDLLVELGVAGGRTGCRTVAEAVDLARAVDGQAGVRLAGIAGYEGVLGHVEDAVTAVRGYLADLRAVLEQVTGICGGSPIVTVGGSMWFDLVVEELGPAATDGNALLVLRSGCYVAHDHGPYAASGPATRGQGPRLRPALRLWAQVLSVPEPGLALAGFGRRDCSFDAGLPVALERLVGDGHLEPVDAVRVVGLNDQHAFLHHDGSLRVGDVLTFGISHPCTTFDKWRLIPTIDAGLTVTGCLTTWF